MGDAMGRSRRQVELTERQRGILETLERAHKTEQRLADRARIVLRLARGLNNLEVSAELGVDAQRVWRWRKRWFERAPRLASAEAEAASDNDLKKLIVSTLSDSFRSGAPQKFSAEQVAQIIALACENPAESGLPVSHWTPPELATEAIERGIVGSISPRQVDRFLKGGRPAPPQEPVLAERQDQGGRP
jgi:transposase